jgi:hypothetical protein
MNKLLQTFDQVWEESELISKQLNSDSKPSSIIDEISLKLNLYKSICENESMDSDEKFKTQEFIMGEILFSLSALSYNENINVFKALKTVSKYKAISLYSKK